jgi:hypothetical protein
VEHRKPLRHGTADIVADNVGIGERPPIHQRCQHIDLPRNGRVDRGIAGAFRVAVTEQIEEVHAPPGRGQSGHHIAPDP